MTDIVEKCKKIEMVTAFTCAGIGIVSAVITGILHRDSFSYNTNPYVNPYMMQQPNQAVNPYMQQPQPQPTPNIANSVIDAVKTSINLARNMSAPPPTVYGAPAAAPLFGTTPYDSFYNYYSLPYGQMSTYNPYVNNAVVSTPYQSGYVSMPSQRTHTDMMSEKYAHYTPDPWSYYEPRATYPQNTTTGYGMTNGQSTEAWVLPYLQKPAGTWFDKPITPQPTMYPYGIGPYVSSPQQTTSPYGMNSYVSSPQQMEPPSNSSLDVFNQFNSEMSKLDPNDPLGVRKTAQSPSMFGNPGYFDTHGSRRGNGDLVNATPNAYTGLGTMEEYNKLHPGMTPTFSYEGQYIL